MDTKTLTLAEFLLARFDEDEQTIRVVSNGGAIVGGVVAESMGDALSVERMLLDIRAKRLVVETVRGWIDADQGATHQTTLRLGAEDVLSMLALPYIGHPDLRYEWRPHGYG